MSYGDNKLYLYENNIELVVTTDYVYVDNRPMNNRKLKVHKGVANEIIFSIRDRDRKLQNVFADSLFATVVDPNTRSRLFVKSLTDTLDIGKVKLTVTEADTNMLEPGLYHVYITRDTGDAAYPVYTDQDNNMRFEIEITDQVYTTAVETQETTTLIQTGNTLLNDPANTFVSSALYGNLDRNFPSAQHTMAIYVDNFSGNIKIQASCLSGVPDSDDASTDWFDVSTLQVSTTDEIVSSSFVANCNWVRVLSEPLSGSITKIQLRN